MKRRYGQQIPFQQDKTLEDKRTLAKIRTKLSRQITGTAIR